MTERLATTRFIDTDFGDWYSQGLPGDLAIQGLGLPDTLEEFAGTELPGFENILADAIVAADEPRNPYHGLLHAQRVTESTYAAYDALQELWGVHLPEGFLQPVLLGTAGHDHGHPGATFFADADPERVPADAGADMAVEWYSARLNAERLKRVGGTLGQQAVAAYIPASSAYGAHEAHGKRLGLERASNPKGIAGLIMRAADVTPQPGEYATSVIEEAAITYGETRGKVVPETVAQHIVQREGFLRGYVRPTYDALDAAVQAPLTGVLGWRERLARRLDDTEALSKEGFSLQRAMLKAEAAKYGRELA